MDPTYIVYYCTMDQELGANPLWHTCILLAKSDEQTKRMKIVDRRGFYGQPTTQEDSYGRYIKIKLGLDVDLNSNYGKLVKEKMRYLDAPSGLHVVPFEVTEEKFNELQKRFNTMEAKQEEAIAEAVSGLGIVGKKKFRIDRYEHLSSAINILEQAAAAEQGRSPRLKPFALDPREPHTCKMQAIDLLKGILTDEQIEHITGYHEAVSRMSGEMETLQLHSTGPLKAFKKPSGEVVYNRDEDSHEAGLWVTVLPQLTTYLSDKTKKLFEIPGGYGPAVKEVAKKLAQLELIFQNANLEPRYNACRDKLVKIIQDHKAMFGVIEPKKAVVRDDSWTGYGRWLLFSEARDVDEFGMQEKLKQADSLVKGLQEAALDTNSNFDINAEGADLLALAAHLPPNSYQDLCNLLNVYVEDDEDLLRAVC